MSVLIRGMKMPRDCYECEVWFKCFDDKPPFNMIKSVCPLVEVKEPHGRLIDADETIRIWEGATIEGSIKPLIDARPTVIEAEGSDG